MERERRVSSHYAFQSALAQQTGDGQPLAAPLVIKAVAGGLCGTRLIDGA